MKIMKDHPRLYCKHCNKKIYERLCMFIETKKVVSTYCPKCGNLIKTKKKGK